MRTINFRDAYEFDPESYAEDGGLPGLRSSAERHSPSFAA